MWGVSWLPLAVLERPAWLYVPAGTLLVGLAIGVWAWWWVAAMAAVVAAVLLGWGLFRAFIFGPLVEYTGRRFGGQTVADSLPWKDNYRRVGRFYVMAATTAEEIAAMLPDDGRIAREVVLLRTVADATLASGRSRPDAAVGPDVVRAARQVAEDAVERFPRSIERADNASEGDLIEAVRAMSEAARAVRAGISTIGP